MRWDRSCVFRKQPRATVNASEEATTETLCNRGGISSAFTRSTAAFPLLKRCNTMCVCVCLWEPPESQPGAKRDPQLLQTHGFANLTSSPTGSTAPANPSGLQLLTHRPPGAHPQLVCVHLAFMVSRRPLDHDRSLKVVLENELCARNAVYFSFTSFRGYFFR